MQSSGFGGKTAFVTGAAGGIGRAVVAALLGEGARVTAIDVATEGLADLACARLHVEAIDVGRSADVDRAVEGADARWDGIDCGVNVAGVLSTAPILDTTDAEWDRAFDVNAGGVFRVSRALARHMIPRRRGSIVTVGSNAAAVPRQNMAAYAASKAAATMFTRVLGLELARFGIRCNVVAPGSTLTPMQTGMWRDEHGAARVIAGSPDMFKAGIPLGKLATPEDIANAVLFLLSDRAGHVTMADLYVDGGATLRG